MDPIQLFLKGRIKAVNIGIREFADSLKKQDVEVVHLSWAPPAGGDKEIIELLDRLI